MAGICEIRTLAGHAIADSLRIMSVTEGFTAPTSGEDVERYIAEHDIEFLFAQFVDMHGKPNAKLVPSGTSTD